ncbi:MAG: alpha/beta hydrolase [Flavobacteriia bacterium]|nr:alpha/beta hydrolase [Flavobacteriia bacterium]
MKFPSLFTFLFLLSLNAFAQIESSISRDNLIIGEQFKIIFDAANEERTINVYLPHSYHPDSTRTYPVIYLLDGSMDEDFLHIVGLVQFGSMPWINHLPESIVVGISNVDRVRDFTDSSALALDQEEFPTSGGSEKFIEFIENTLFPAIGSNYQVSDQRTIIGQSLGGLLATQILFEHPDLFDDYIIVSPSLWWNNESLLDQRLGSLEEKDIYIAVGDEGEAMRGYAEGLCEKIRPNHPESERVHFDFFPQCDHGDVLHLAVYNAFQVIEE